MPRHLVPELRQLIFNFLPFKVLQLFEETEVLGFSKLKPLFTKDKITKLIRFRYLLNNNQIELSFNTPINDDILSPMEAFTNIAAFSGNIGYEGQVYIDNLYCLLYAVMKKDLNLVIYYLGRNRLVMANDLEFYRIILYYATKSDNIDIFRSICALQYLTMGTLPAIIDNPVFLLSPTIANYLFKANASLFYRSSIADYYKNNVKLNLDDYIRYIYKNNKLNLNQILELAQPVLLSDYFSFLYKNPIIFPNIKPYYFNLFGYYTYIQTFDQLSISFIIDADQVKRARRLKQLVLTHFIDSAYRECYINYLNLILNINITFNLITVDKQFDNLFIAFMLSVLHGQAIRIALSANIALNIVNIPKTEFSTPQTGHIMYSNIVYDITIYDKIKVFEDNIYNFKIITTNIWLAHKYGDYLLYNLPARLIVFRQPYNWRHADRIIGPHAIEDYETMLHLNDQARDLWAVWIRPCNIYVFNQYQNDNILYPLLIKHYKATILLSDINNVTDAQVQAEVIKDRKRLENEAKLYDKNLNDTDIGRYL